MYLLDIKYIFTKRHWIYNSGNKQKLKKKKEKENSFIFFSNKMVVE